MKATDCHCPTCLSPEMHPDNTKLLIRGLKVHDGQGWCSQCLVCSGYYDKDLNETADKHDAEKGWYYEHEQIPCDQATFFKCHKCGWEGMVRTYENDPPSCGLCG